jgi:hypothetical protein
MATTPAWLEAAAKLDEPAKEQLTLPTPRTAEPEVPPEAKPRPRITPPPPDAIIPPPSVETDLAWHGYSIAALVPSTVALAAFTLSALVILRPLAPAWVVHESADAPLAALWLLQAVRAGYRLLGYNYRLSTRCLYRSRGRLYPTDPPLELATVVKTEVKQTLLGKLIGVGTVRVVPEDEAAAVELTGVRRPSVLAARIEEAATAAREASVTTGRLHTPSERR